MKIDRMGPIFSSDDDKLDGSRCWFAGEGEKITARIMYEMYVSKVPSNKIVKLLCKVAKCINPSHMILVAKPARKTTKKTSRKKKITKKEL